MGLLDTLQQWGQKYGGTIADLLVPGVGQAADELQPYAGALKGILPDWATDWGVAARQVFNYPSVAPESVTLPGISASTAGGALASAKSSYLTTQRFGGNMPGLDILAGPGVIGSSVFSIGRKGLIPFEGSQSWPGPGYRIATRKYRRAQPERMPGFYWVPRRSMNPLNPRALKRAARRIKAASRWARTIVTMSKSKAVRGGARRRSKKR